jgi:DNA-binding GntR family transcriptional regulator
MFVRPLAPEDVRQQYELRGLLEPWAARLACQRASDRERVALDAIQRQHERKAPSFDGTRKFHLRVVEACGNELALRVLRGLWAQDRSPQIYSVYGHQPSALESMVHEHRQIVDAFMAGEAETVERLVREHILQSRFVTESGIEPATSPSDPS